MFHNKTAVITGAGSGIGRALALGMVERGAHLALSDVNAESLEETAELCRARRTGIRLTTHVFDVADRAAFHRFADMTLAEHGDVHIVINNAGVALGATVAEMSYTDLEWIFGINFWGVVYGTKAFLPHMLERGDGYIVNLSSLFGLIAVPTQSAYNATKFAVRGFTEALAMEVADTDIVVSSVHPGGVRTNIARASRFSGKPMGIDRGMAVRNFDRMARLSPEGAANIIFDGMAARRRRIIVGTDAEWLDRVQRLFPETYGNVIQSMRSRFLKKSSSSSSPNNTPSHQTSSGRLGHTLTHGLGKLLDAVAGPHVLQGRTLDPQQRAMIHFTRVMGHAPLNTYTPKHARRQFKARVRPFEPRARAMAHVNDTRLQRPTPSTADPETAGIPARVYVPTTLPPGDKADILVWFHGGGYVIGDLDSYDSPMRTIAHDAATIVVAIDYRLAPEHPFPAAWEDAVDAFRAVQAMAAELGGDPDRVAVGGDSAGGNLAAGVALAARGDAPPLFQLLVCPGLDMHRALPSQRVNGHGYLTDGALIDWFVHHYITDASHKDDPRASPLAAEDLSGLAPALIYTCGFDPLQDDGEKYADRLKESGVPTAFRCFHSQIHDYILFTGFSDAAFDAMNTTTAAIRRSFETR